MITIVLVSSDLVNAQSTSLLSRAIASKSNPNISVNALFLGRTSNFGSPNTAGTPNGFSLQEIETRYTTNIDAYFKGDIILALEKENGAWKIEPEEAFVETISIDDFVIRTGKSLAKIG